METLLASAAVLAFAIGALLLRRIAQQFQANGGDSLRDRFDEHMVAGTVAADEASRKAELFEAKFDVHLETEREARIRTDARLESLTGHIIEALSRR